MKTKLLKAIIMLTKRFLQIVVAQILFYTLVIANDGNSQRLSIDDIYVRLDKRQMEVIEIFREIEAQSQFKFSYEERDVEDKVYFVFNGSTQSIYKILSRVSKKASLKFRRLNNVIDVSRIGEELPKNSIEEVFLEKTITGKVTDENGQGLPGASIIVKGTATGTTTDLNGNYKLDVPDDAILIISYVGYSNQEIAVAGRSTVDVQLVPDLAQLKEIVVVGYGEQEKVTVTGAVTAIEGKELVKSPAVEISNSLAGRLPGVVVIQTSGEPGLDGARINIRGTNTLGNSSPLIVIDGIPDRDGGLGRLSPQDIESISVLKDASAAIYGARAANGAILINTKRGKTGKPTITFDFNQGWSQPTRIPEMSNAGEYANIMNELPIYQTIPVNEWSAAWNSIQSTGIYTSPTPGVSSLSANFSPEAVQKHIDGSDPWGFPDTDWFGDAFKTWSPQKRYNLQITGGTENLKYLGSLGFVNQDAYYHNSATFYKQYNLRLNLDAKVNDYINTRLGVMARREDRNFPTQSAGSIFRMLMRGRPTEPEVWPNGKPGPDIENGQNPYVITTNATGYEKSPTDYIQANGSVEITQPWIEGLKLTFSGAIDKSNETSKKWETPWMLYFWDRISYEPDGVTPLLEGSIRSNFTDPRLTQTSRSTLNTNLTTMLSYDRAFGNDHTINILAGVTRETFEGENFNAFRRNYISSAVDQLFAGGSLQQNTGGSAFERARLGYYGRFQYNFKQKYLAEFIWRYDGSYIFPESDRFGFFPGVLVGWNISNEDFFNLSFIDYLKIRASYGQMGNDQVFFRNRLQEYAYLSTYGFGEYPINSVVETTLEETILANPSFTWERANNFNVGLDGTILNGKLDFTLEYFYNKRDQILIQKTGSTPASSGISELLPPVNAGKVDNRGFEFSFLYNNQSSDLRYSIGVNGGFAKNKVVFMDEIPGAPDYQRQEGKPIGGYLVYKSAGVFRDAEEIASNTIDYSGVTSQLLPGDMKFEDINNDGVIDADDQIRLDENNTPTFNFGATFDLQWKNFDFSLLFQGATGASIRIQTESGDIGNYLKYSHDNRWRIDNPSSEHPRLASRGDTYYTGGNFGNNTYFLFSKNYIRLKNIELGYRLPKTIIGEGKVISGLRVYVNALNLVTFDKYKIFDPEAIQGNGVYYPQARVINTGFSLTF
ncbi:TonB-dependent receptor [Fulvivirgaceae bacterium BMA10]|uniref:TonB-dependent receptor n=1 Tax=Splendidivirga corallicola TaxID=3051826 RepID=A0ABT8KNA2_9BACT|nr:TonB-dependent receptor [Fulvivirgaceae bacterium BMA10]